MSLYGALFSGVSGLNAQSNKLGVISDNISNVNTVGYKAATGTFGTLVTNSGTTTAYSPGGVIGSSRATVSKQGLLQTTASSTDIGIQGAGFFVVNQSFDGTGQVEYTRAGSFTADATGNFKNSAGLYLQAWPLDRDGRLPGEPGNLNTTSSANLSSLETVNVQSLTGSAAATTSLSLSANLTSSQSAFLGASGTVTMDALDARNATVAAKDVIIPSTVNSTQRGDRFVVATGAGVSYTYTYGGFTYGRDITSAANGDSGMATLSSPTISGVTSTLNNTPTTLTNGLATDGATGVVTITQTAHGFKTGDHITISGASAVGGITAPQLNTASGFTVTVIDDNTYTITTAGTSTSVVASGGVAPTITPDPFATTNASHVVTVTSHGHGLLAGDEITFAGISAAVGGIPASELNATYTVTSVIDADHYTITTTTTTGNGNGGGTGTITQEPAPFKTTSGSSIVRIRDVAHGLKTGQVVTLSGVTAALATNIQPGDLNTSFKVTVVDDDHYTIDTGVNAASTTTGGGSDTIVASARPFIGNILDATNPNQPFLGTTTTTPFTASALKFTIATSTTGTVTFTYTSGTASAEAGTFNTLTNLAAAINNVQGLSARVANNRLYVSATDSNEAITFANVQDTGDDTGATTLSGIDWVSELGLRNVASGSNRFATMEGLAAVVNDSPGLKATIDNESADSSVHIYVKDPLDTITFTDKAAVPALTALSGNQFRTTAGSRTVQITMPSTLTFVTGDVVHLSGTLSDTGSDVNGISESAFSGDFEITKNGNNTFTIELPTKATSTGVADATGLIVTPPNNSGSMLAALGLVKSLNNSSYTVQTTGALGPAYDPTDATKNMASNSIPPHSTRPGIIYDAQGTGHDINISFLKTDANTWAVEVYAVPATDVNSSLPNGQIAYGTLIFNGDGTLRSLSSGLTTESTIQWTNGASSSAVSFNFGTAGQPAGTPGATVIGLADGMSQQSADYSLNFFKQNGAPVGKLTGVSIDRAGFITASYSNGETQKLFKIPLASFTNPDELLGVSGNAFTQTNSSGEVNLKQADTSGVGYIASSSLEASNVELADQLTDMIVAQRAYQANTKVISTADQLLDNLNQILR